MTTIEVLGPDRLTELRGPLHELYRLCFAEPPWSEPPEQLDAHPDVLAKDLARPGMSGIVALDGPTVAAVVYGWPAGHRLPDEPVFRTHPDAPARSLYEATGWRALVSYTSPGGRPGLIYTLA